MEHNKNRRKNRNQYFLLFYFFGMMVSQYFARKCIDENYFIHLVISEIKKIRKSRGLKLINNMQR